MTAQYAADLGAPPTRATARPGPPDDQWDPRPLSLADPDLDLSRPRWTRHALWALLATTALLYLWGLAASGWANSFYSAAAQAGADNWQAFLFGSSDMANSITVDKPPASLWVMALSVKVFGLSSWSILVPQALMGVASVWLLFLTVRRWYGEVAGLIAGTVLAITPVSVLMFRFNNPDALLTLLMVAAAYAVTRATEKASWRWLVGAGVLMGFAFLTKSLQAFLVLPAFAAAYAVAAPTGRVGRLRDLALAGFALVLSAGWWIVLVELWPADSRPYIGGSQTNSVWELIVGYNGLGRITGNEVGSVVPGGGTGGGMWGETSWHRMFDGSWAGQIAWLIPAALVLAVAGFWLTRRQPRTGLLRTGLVLWSGWLLVTLLVFSFASGIIHEYYAVALAPAIGALAGIGAVLLWRLRDRALARLTLAVVVTGSALYGAWLLTRAGGGYAALGVIVSVAAVLVGVVLVWDRDGRWRAATATAALVVVLAGPLAFSVQTAATAHTGSLPSAGPALAGSRGGPGGGGGFGPGGRGGNGPLGAPNTATGQNGTTIMPMVPPQGAGTTGGFGGGQGGGPGGLLDAATPSSELVGTLNEGADRFTWVAAAIGSQNSAGYQLATGSSVMPIGGFNGSDPSPTLAQFQQYVAEGRIHYFIGGGMGGPGGGMGGAGGGMGGPGGADGNSSNTIAQWVQENFTTTTVDGVTLYDLTQPSS